MLPRHTKACFLTTNFIYESNFLLLSVAPSPHSCPSCRELLISTAKTRGDHGWKVGTVHCSVESCSSRQSRWISWSCKCSHSFSLGGDPYELPSDWFLHNSRSTGCPGHLAEGRVDTYTSGCCATSLEFWQVLYVDPCRSPGNYITYETKTCKNIASSKNQNCFEGNALFLFKSVTTMDSYDFIFSWNPPHLSS